jgi:hypothetical protein
VKKISLRLDTSEGIVTRSAATIYAAYIAAGKVTAGQEEQMMRKALDEAIWLARTADDMILSDNEMS